MIKFVIVLFIWISWESLWINMQHKILSFNCLFNNVCRLQRSWDLKKNQLMFPLLIAAANVSSQKVNCKGWFLPSICRKGWLTKLFLQAMQVRRKWIFCYGTGYFLLEMRLCVKRNKVENATKKTREKCEKSTKSQYHCVCYRLYIVKI